MDANYGGPVWHASVRHHGRDTDPAEVGLRCLRALRGVGDAELGQWWEYGGTLRATHLRRRVTAEEWASHERPIPWGTDLRKSPEGDRRLEAAKCRREWSPEEYQ